MLSHHVGPRHASVHPLWVLLGHSILLQAQGVVYVLTGTADDGLGRGHRDRVLGEYAYPALGVKSAGAATLTARAWPFGGHLGVAGVLPGDLRLPSVEGQSGTRARRRQLGSWWRREVRAQVLGQLEVESASSLR